MLTNRPRRLRNSELLRNMVRETHMSPSSLILPFFAKEGKGLIENIPSMDGVKRYSPDTLLFGVEEALNAGVKSVLLFGLPKEKDEIGSGAYSENGIIQESVREIKKRFKDDVFVITDVCMCEYTSHGHCGIICDGDVDNDSTLDLLTKTALSHVQAGSDMVAPSDMMDGRVAAIRSFLDQNGFKNTAIMSYGAKYASAFYGPFRDAADSAPQFGDRKTYQMDYHNSKEAVKEILLDIDENADIVIIKPALSFLDIIKEVSDMVNIPVAAYSVSGEYSMIKAASAAGFIDEYKIMCETAVSCYRAGSDILISYYAKELAKAMKCGDIG